MGNKLKLFPRVDTIDFPKTEQGKEYDLTHYKDKEVNPIHVEVNSVPHGSSIYLLKSGNILISYCMQTETGAKSFLAIYSLPELKEIQLYEFKETEVLYKVEYALQLKNGNILAIYDKFYEFDGENIKEGPKNISSNLDNTYFSRIQGQFSHPIIPDKIVTKYIYGFDIHYLFEEKEGLLLYTRLKKSYEIYSINLENFEDIKIKDLYSTYKEEQEFSRGNVDIALHSEYYPENIYLVINVGISKPSSSYLRIFNYEDFISGKCNKKNDVTTKLLISKSSNVFALCEYDKQYLLLDTITNNIYIFDMINRQKVALCVPTKEGVLPRGAPKNKFMQILERTGDSPIEIKVDRDTRFMYTYRKIYKLKDGKILIHGKRNLKIVDVAMQKSYEGNNLCSCQYVVNEKYIASILMDGTVYVIKIYKDDE